MCVHTQTVTLLSCHHWGALKLPAQLQALFNGHTHTHTYTAWVLVNITEAITIILLLRRWILFLSAGSNNSWTIFILHMYVHWYTRARILNMDMRDGNKTKYFLKDIPGVCTDSKFKVKDDFLYKVISTPCFNTKNNLAQDKIRQCYLGPFNRIYMLKLCSPQPNCQTFHGSSFLNMMLLNKVINQQSVD